MAKTAALAIAEEVVRDLGASFETSEAAHMIAERLTLPVMTDPLTRQHYAGLLAREAARRFRENGRRALESTTKTGDDGETVRQYKLFAAMGETEIVAVVSLTRSQAASLVAKHNALVEELERRGMAGMRRVALVELDNATAAR
jgi:hypothetical protein